MKKTIELPVSKGTYMLVMAIPRSVQILYGKGETSLKLKKGWAYYVGSAFNSGGFRARVGRHLLLEKSLRWHIDYLRPYVNMKEIWLIPDVQCECEVASLFAKRITVLDRFGASDCHCHSHLFYSKLKWVFSEFKGQFENRYVMKRVVV